jgi:acetyl-CoA synthetase
MKNLKLFWRTKLKLILWKKKPSIILKIKKNNKHHWFLDGKLNVYENCILNKLNTKNKKKIAIKYFSEENNYKEYTYEQLHNLVLKYEFFLRSNINKKLSQSKLMLQSSTNIQTIGLILACVKLGIEYCATFEDLAEEGILKRIKLFRPDLFFCNNIKSKLIKKHQKKFNFINLTFEEVDNSKNTMFIEKKLNYFHSNKSLFTLFTSGSTGMPKGIVHSSGGFLLYTIFTLKNQFGMNTKSTILTASDIGWLNGHNYMLFGPLSIGATTLILEKPLNLLNSKFLEEVLNKNVTILYLPVTLIRIMRAIFGEKKFLRNSLETLGSMGEHIAPHVAKWFANTFLKKDKPIVNAYYQTENGGIIASPKFKDSISECPHGSAGKLSTKFIKINKLSAVEKKELKILTPWPGLMKDILSDDKKAWSKYWDKNRNFKMFDEATIKNKNLFIHGRSDDVINIRGKRVGCEEIESNLLEIKHVKECCAVGYDDLLEGNKIVIFLSSKKKNIDTMLINKLKSNFGSHLIPSKIIYLSRLPKTKSGKILRRLLRDILNKKNKYGDLSTIQDKDIIDELLTKTK